MPAPPDILNGDVPDATILMAWLNYLNGGGGGIRMDTKSNLRAVALAAPTAAFMCIATDEGAGGSFYIYMGNTIAGDGGFVLLGG